MPKDEGGSPSPFDVRVADRDQLGEEEERTGGLQYTVGPGSHLKLEVECRRQDKVKN